ncbi:MAG: PepSY-associated TM helix domain-containing protein [Pseudomonadota bacterium]
MKLDVRAHRWLGLLLGGWFAFAGLTGAVLVFWKPIEDLEFGASPVASGAALPLEALVASALARRPGGDAFRIFLPEQAVDPARVEILGSPDGRVSIHVDPVSGAILGERAWGGAAIHWLYDLHSGGILGRRGVVTVGVLGVVLAGLALLGLILWARYAWRPLRDAIWPRGGLRGLRRLRNLHRPAGLWLSLPLVLAGATGFGLAFPEVVRDLVPPLLEAESPARRVQGSGKPITLADALASAEAAMPGWRGAWIELPEPGRAPDVVVRLRPADPRRVDGIAQVFVALDSGAMKVTPAAPVERVRAWIMALHNGHAFGLGHQLAIILLGLTPVLLFVTGFLAWRRRSVPVRQRQAEGAGSERSQPNHQAKPARDPAAPA